MYEIFTDVYQLKGSVVHPPAFELIKRIYDREIQSVVGYYNSRVFATKSQHLLCRMLITGMPPLDYEVDHFMDVAYTRSPFVGKHFRLTSPITAGDLFDGVFYGEGYKEIIFYDETYFDPFDAIQNWKKLKPVKVLWHPVSDLSLVLQNGQKNHTGQGLCMISINLPMLYLMYRGFMQRQALRHQYEDPENPVSTLAEAHFVHMYVLPGMLESHLDIALVNRFINQAETIPMTQALRTLPFPVVDYHGKVDSVFKDLVNYMKTHPMSYTQMLRHIPSISVSDALQAMKMPDLAPTRQVYWAMIATRLPLMKALIDIGDFKGRVFNRDHIVKLKLALKSLKRNQGFTMIQDADVRYELGELLDECIDLVS